ncbi:MAG: DUF2214 domain-containing protein [Chelatococcus sp.]|jgi:hypothetical protein|uniref:DUF6644 family protein n=1 Tax=unclassified Chelatococcus TaxID=2638111 RepID=UPI001BCF7215|nr:MULTISPECIES: DUF6644 family protein [unclassified Chelatococcus]CAH1673482.1 conserved membrane hypothetical protein [Hyphomicrobiales bacterium]MBS7738817.1 DUF2214 domain-containing protein [Chelatococcus sp. HY11]MBX3539596.1 DUF2214 domain-containing protein [Chelatococcus sp.]MBX3547282.1 DUF2214 domain-containing protein [Chelatococcus sp.]MCO5076652.1 DUF2214 domain-containing protein [Chelatococcus sp.]
MGTWPGAVWLQSSGTAYLFVNAAHILSIGLVLGGILPLDLRLMGFSRATSLAVIGPFLSRVAATGVVLAIATGLWLFSVRPAEYARNPAFMAKLVLLAVALVNVFVQHRSRDFQAALRGARVTMAVRLRAAASAMLWLLVLIAGRWIGFV